MPVYWGIFGGSNFRGFHGYYVIRPMKNYVQYRMGMIVWGAKCVKNAVFVYLPLIYKCGTDLAKYLPAYYQS